MRGNDVRHMPRPPQYPGTHTQYGMIVYGEAVSGGEGGIRIDNTLRPNESIRFMVGGGGVNGGIIIEGGLPVFWCQRSSDPCPCFFFWAGKGG